MILGAPPVDHVWVVVAGDDGIAHMAAVEDNTISGETVCGEDVSHQVSADTDGLEICDTCSDDV